MQNFNIWKWLGIEFQPERSTKVGHFAGFLLVALLLIFVVISVALVIQFAAIIFATSPDKLRSADGIRNVGLALAAVVGVPFVVWRSVVAQQQVNVSDQGLITDRINKAVEGLGAEKTVSRVYETPRYRKTKDGDWQRDKDGNLIPALRPDGQPMIDREVVQESIPNMEVRIGAIYALERIAQDSDRDHVQIMEILCAYIRENSPLESAVPMPELDMPDWDNLPPYWDGDNFRQSIEDTLRDELKSKIKTRLDIQTALTVLGRRSAAQRQLEAQAHRGQRGDVFIFDRGIPEFPNTDGIEDLQIAEIANTYRINSAQKREAFRVYQGHRLDLRACDLQGYDFAGLNLRGAELRGAKLQGADLGRAKLLGVNLSDAELQGANLSFAELHGADLKGAELQGADLGSAELQGADLGGAELQGAVLGYAKLQGADLWVAKVQGAAIWDAKLQGAQFGFAELKGADLGDVKLQGAVLAATKLQGADLRGAKLQGIDLGGAKLDEKTNLAATALRGAVLRFVDYRNIQQISEHLNGMFGDASVTLPSGGGPDSDAWPKHWPKFELDYFEFISEWGKWLANPEGYEPPDPPADATE